MKASEDSPCSGPFAWTGSVVLKIFSCSGILKLCYIFKTLSYSSNNLRRVACTCRQWNISSAKHLTLCSATISTQQTSLPQIKTLNPLGNKKQQRKPPYTGMTSSGGYFQCLHKLTVICEIVLVHIVNQQLYNCKIRAKKQIKYKMCIKTMNQLECVTPMVSSA